MRIFGTLILPGPTEGAVRLAEGAVEVEAGRIVAVDEGDWGNSHQADLGGDPARYVICPGFIDTHLHLPQFDIRGVQGMALMDWLGRVVFPAERRWADPATARADTHQTIDRLLGHGTTGIGAYASVHHEASRAALEVCQQRGMHALVGQVLMDQHAPNDLLGPTSQLLDQTESLLNDFGVDGQVAAAVTPRFGPSCSLDLLKGAGQLTQLYDAAVQTHLAETHDECKTVERLHGKAYTALYAETGLLGPRSILGHGVHLDQTDRRRLADHESVVAHCPVANTFLDSGEMDQQALAQAGVRMALGSDIGAGYEIAMPRVARAMIHTARSVSGAKYVPRAAEAWWQMTTANAEAMGWADTGRLARGARADLLIIEPDMAWSDHPDPLGALLFGWDDHWLKTTLCGGRIVYPKAEG